MRVVFDQFPSNFAYELILARSGLELQMGKFRQMTLELWPLIEVKNCIFFVSAF